MLHAASFCSRLPSFLASAWEMPAHLPPALAAGHWVLVEGGEEALKEAVLTKG